MLRAKVEAGSAGLTRARLEKLMQRQEASRYEGRCHCGAVRFEADIDLQAGATRCNCSICMRRGALTAIVKPASFHLLTDETALAEYQPGLGRYSFCKTCGIHVFGRVTLERLGGPIVAINLNCIDAIDLSGTKILHLDGRNDSWEVLRTEQVA